MTVDECTILVTDRWEAISEPWRELERDGACYPFQTLAWVSTVIDTIGRAQGSEPKLVLVGDRTGRPLMLVPFAMRRHRGLRILEFIDFKVSDYNAPLIRREFARSLGETGFAALWSRILAAIGPVDAFRLEKMPEEIDGAPNPFRQLRCAVTEQAYLAFIEGDAGRYFATRSKTSVDNLRRKRRNLAKLGAIALETADGAEDADRLAETMIEWKSQRYRATGVPDLFDDPSYAEFYRTIARRECSGLVHISALTVGGEPVSVVLSTRFRQRLYFLMPAFDAGERSRFSPGHLHIMAIAEWCGEHDQRILDFTWGNEAYKATWSTDAVPLYGFCRGRSLAGRAWSRGHLFRQVVYRTAKEQVSRHPELLTTTKKWRKGIRDAFRKGLSTGSRISEPPMPPQRAVRNEGAP